VILYEKYTIFFFLFTSGNILELVPPRGLFSHSPMGGSYRPLGISYRPMVISHRAMGT
jgi:hypothetical protein